MSLPLAVEAVRTRTFYRDISNGSRGKESKPRKRGSTPARTRLEARTAPENLGGYFMAQCKRIAEHCVPPTPHATSIPFVRYIFCLFVLVERVPISWPLGSMAFVEQNGKKTVSMFRTCKIGGNK